MGEGPTMPPGDRPIDIEILLEHRAFVRRLASRLVRDPATVDDLEQDTWVAALRHPPRETTPVRAWLTSVVRKLAWTRRRSELRRARREHERVLPEAPPDAPELLERAAWSQRLVGAVMRLDEPYRTTILLRYFEGLSGSDVARLQAVPAATVRTRIRRGLERLRARLDADTEGGRSVWMAALLPLAAGPLPHPLPATAPAPGGAPTPSWLLPAAAVALVGLAALTLVVGRRDETGPPRAGSRADQASAPVPAGATARVPGGDGPASAARPHALDVVVLGHGRRVPGARVVLAARPPHAWKWSGDGPARAVRQALADGEGEARFDGLGAGYVEVVAAAPGFGRASAVAWLPREFGQAVVVELGPEAVRRLRVVRRGDGAPIPGATVALRGPAGEPALGATAPDPADAHGGVALEGLSEDDPVRWTVHAPGYVPSPARALPSAADTRVELEARGRRVSWAIGGGGVAPPADGSGLVLRRPEEADGGLDYGDARILAGCVVADDLPSGVLPELLAVARDGSFARLVVEPGSDEGEPTRFERPARLALTLREERGAPVAGALLLPVIEATGTPLHGSARTGADGRAVLPIEVREPVEVRLAGDGAEPPRVLGRFDPRSGDARLSVVLPDARLVLLAVGTPSGPGLDEPFELVCGGRRVPGDAIGAPRASPWRLRVRPERQGEPVAVWLLARGFVPAVLRVDATVAEPLEAQLELRPAARLVLPVLVRRPDQPLRLVLEVPADGPSPGREARRGPLPFRLHPGPDRVVREAMIPAGRYRVRDLAGGAATPVLELRAGETLRAPLLDLSTPSGEAGEQVRGWVEAYGDIDLSRAHVVLTDADGAPVRRSEVARDGSFVLGWPGPGPWTVALEHADLEPARLPRATLREPREDLLLRLTPWNRAFVRLVPRPAPAPDGATPPRVRLRREDGSVLDPTVALHGDELHFAGHRAGPSNVEIDVPGYRPVELGSRALVEGTTDLGTVAIEHGTTVRVEILVPPGSLCPALTISAQATGEPRYRRSTWTGGEVEASLTGLGPGRFQLTAWERYTGRQVWSGTVEADGSNDVRLTVDLR